LTDRVRDGLGHEYAAAFLEHAVLEHCIASNTFCVAFRMRDGVHTGIPSRTGWQLLTSLPLTAISPREPTSMLSGLFLPRLFLSGGSDARFESWKTLSVLTVAALASCMWLIATTPALAADEEHPETTEASAAADAHGDADHGDADHGDAGHSDAHHDDAHHDDGHGDDGHGDDHAHGHHLEIGHSALDGDELRAFESPAYFQGDLAIWSFAVFVLLLMLLTKFAWKPIMEGLDKREQSIADTIAATQRANDEARQMLASYEKRLAEAADEVRGMLEEARRDADATKQTIITEARKAAEEEQKRAKHEIALATDEALSSIAERAGELAVSVAGKFLKEKLSGDDQQRLIRDSAAAIHSTPSVN
jgi:F-type H+-transporting ATPase subunit b